MVHQDVSGAFSRKFRGGDGEHTCTTGEAVREEKNVGTASSSGRQAPKVVNANGDARAAGQGDV